MCRVVKKNGNTDKTFARGDATLKPAGNCSSSSDAFSNEPVVTFNNMPSQTNDSYNESNHATHFTSQYPVEPTEGYNLSSSLWDSPNIILDSYKVVRLVIARLKFTSSGSCSNFITKLVIVTGMLSTV